MYRSLHSLGWELRIQPSTCCCDVQRLVGDHRIDLEPCGIKQVDLVYFVILTYSAASWTTPLTYLCIYLFMFIHCDDNGLYTIDHVYIQHMHWVNLPLYRFPQHQQMPKSSPFGICQLLTIICWYTFFFFFEDWSTFFCNLALNSTQIAQLKERRVETQEKLLDGRTAQRAGLVQVSWVDGWTNPFPFLSSPQLPTLNVYFMATAAPPLMLSGTLLGLFSQGKCFA